MDVDVSDCGEAVEECSTCWHYSEAENGLCEVGFQFVNPDSACDRWTPMFWDARKSAPEDEVNH